MKKLSDFDVFYKSKIVENIISIRVTEIINSTSSRFILQIEHIDTKNKYKRIEANIKDFEFKLK